MPLEHLLRIDFNVFEQLVCIAFSERKYTQQNNLRVP